MGLAIGLSILVFGCGFAVLRILGLTKGLLALGLAPATGLASVSVVATWCTLMGAPPFVATALVAGMAIVGLGAAARERQAVVALFSAPREQRVALVTLGLSLVIPATILGVAFGGLAVPFSTHDGAYHVEIIDAIRTGAGWHGWYPPGFHSMLAAFLGLTPWVDSAAGTFQASLALTLLGQLAVFGLGCALWQRPLIAAAGAFLVGLTYQFPYTVHFWALWPMVEGLILVLSLWAATVYYLESPGLRWALLSGLIAAGIGLSHTVEVYTAAIGLPFILAANWRRIQWPRLARDLILASGVALALFLPYASAALSWAHGGGAVANGAATGSNADGRLGLSGGLGFLMLDVLAGFVGDAPIRLMLLAVGTWSALRTPNGRALLALSAAFLVLPLTLVYVDVQPVQWLFAVTFPWSHGYRLLMVASLWLAMLGGAGAVSMAERLLVAGRSAVWIRLARRCALLVGTLAAVGAVVLVPLRLTIDGAHDSVFLADDAAAFTWLAAHVHAGELIANDWSSDAGIWLPYKTGGKILFPRFDAGANIPERLLVADDLSGLEASPDGQEAACGLGVRYVYVGASTSSFWDAHRFPSRDQLRQSAALEEVFTSGQASVFRVRVDCPGAST